MTKKLIDAGEIIKIEVADHLIVTKDSYVSIRKFRPKLWQGKGYYAESQ